MSPVKKRLFLGSFYKFISSVFGMLAGIATSVVINRSYGIERYGVLVMVFTVTGFLSGFANLGAKSTLNRILPQMIKKGNDGAGMAKAVLTGFIFVFAGILIFGGIICLFRQPIAAYYKNAAVVPLLLVGVLYLAGFCVVDFIFSVFQGIQDWFKEGLLSVVYPLLALIFIALSAYLFKFNISGVLYSNFTAALLTAFLGIVLLKKIISRKSLSGYNFADFKNYYSRFITFGFPLLFTQVSALLLVWSDKFMLGRFCGAAELSVYYIAFNFINGLMIFTKILFTVVMPYAAELTDKEEIARKYRMLFKVNIHVAAALSLAMFFLIDFVVMKLYGRGYENAAFAVKLMLPLVLIKAVLLTPSIFLQNVFEKVRVLNFGGAGLAITDILMCLLFIPRFGFSGAITASLIAHFLYMCWMICLIPGIKKMTPFPSLFRLLLFACVLSTLYSVMDFLKLNRLFIAFPSLAAVYFIMLKASRELDFLSGLFASVKSRLLSVVKNGI